MEDLLNRISFKYEKAIFATCSKLWPSGRRVGTRIPAGDKAVGKRAWPDRSV